MNNIINIITSGQWDKIKKVLLTEQDSLDWYQPVDQINGVIHFLTYQNRIEIISHIEKDIIIELLSQQNLEGDTVYHIAAKLKYFELLGYYTSIDPDGLYILNRLNYSPLYYIVSECDLIKTICSTYELRDHAVCLEYTLLEFYMQDENYDMFDFLLNELTQISADSIFYAIQLDIDDTLRVDFIEDLIDHGVDINSQNNRFITPLIAACYQDDTSVISLLLEKGADHTYHGPENTDNPMTICLLNKNERCVKNLLKYKFNIAIRDKNLRTPIHYMLSEEVNISDSLKKRLIKNCSDLNAVDNNMDSILNLLMHCDDWRMYKDILCEKRLKIYLKNKSEICPIDAVPENERDEFYNLVTDSYLNELKKRDDWPDTFDRRICLNHTINNQDRQIILERIKDGISYPKRDSNYVTLLLPPSANITHYSSYSYNYICYLHYLLKKYPEIKIPITPEINYTSKEIYRDITKDFQSDDNTDHIIRGILKDYVSHSSKIFNHVIIWKSTDKMFVSPWLEDSIQYTLDKYPDTKFIIFKLTILNEMNMNHANIIIYDVNNSIIERFDPYGTVPFIDGISIDSHLIQLFSNIVPTAEYLSPDDTSQGISFQIFSDEMNKSNYVENDPNGFCMAWCLWYTEMRAKNPSVSPRNLIKKSIKNINKKEDKFKDYIRNYSNYLDKKKNRLLEESNMPSKYWYRRNLPSNYYKDYLKHMHSVFDSLL